MDYEKQKEFDYRVMKLKVKWEKAKRRAKAEAETLYRACKENPVQAAGMFSAGAYTISKIVRYKKVTKEEDRRRTEYYDPRTGKYARARRPLKPREQLEAERRYRDGKETWTEILADMGLLR